MSTKVVIVYKLYHGAKDSDMFLTEDGTFSPEFADAEIFESADSTRDLAREYYAYPIGVDFWLLNY